MGGVVPSSEGRGCHCGRRHAGLAEERALGRRVNIAQGTWEQARGPQRCAGRAGSARPSQRRRSDGWPRRCESRRRSPGARDARRRRVCRQQRGAISTLAPLRLALLPAVPGAVGSTPLLLDQGLLAGLGNIYASEVLFRCGINPCRKGKRVKLREWGKLVAETRSVLNEAIEKNGTSISDFRRVDEKTGEFQNFLRVYEREGKPCVSCGMPVRRIVQQQRSSYFCSGCQV